MMHLSYLRNHDCIIWWFTVWVNVQMVVGKKPDDALIIFTQP